MSVFLDACRRRPTPYTPVWIMRQAGRYQPEYRALRERVGFMELCKSPALCSEVAVRAVEQLGVDAAIVFSDILVVLEPLGVGFEFTKDDGPRIAHPVRSPKDVDRVASEIDPVGSLDYVMNAIRTTKKDLAGRVPLIGFSGAPFTLASYIIEGGGSREYLHTKTLMFSDPGAWNALMTKIADAVSRYLLAQIDAGAECLQLFDSWVGALGPADYVRFVQPHMKRIFDAVGDRVPVIHFGTGNPALLPHMRRAGGHVIGIDQRAELREAWELLEQDGPIAVQGNLDPVLLLASRDVMLERAEALLESVAGKQGHIFNLGHGVLPGAKPDDVRALVDRVHDASQRTSPARPSRLPPSA
ncbi:MAG: uroporphyrinogen decarboxylase [Sandaracinaceae bacterium]|jgi:uroporphyrinogen decarboxylase|nr:uroporphyrinogen decarboxylase [Sandaracinaceae bacterium]